MVYTDVKESNVIIINDGRDAIAIDITGVKSPPSIMQYNIYSQVDMMHAILLLNKMLLEPQKRNSSVRWNPSDADRDNFNSRILDRLENLVSKNYGPYSVEEPLEELQEILEELPGPKPVEKTSTPGHPHESNTGSCEISSSLNSDGIPSPFYLTGSSESENGQPAPGERELNKPIKARKEKQNQTEILEKFPQQAAPMPYHPSQQGYGAPTAAYPYRSAPVALQELYTVPPAGQAATKVGPPPGLQMSVGGFGGVTIRIQSDALESGCLIGGLVAGASAAAAFAASKVSDSAGGVAGAGLVAGVATGVTTLAAFYLGNRQQTDEAIREAVARDRQIQAGYWVIRTLNERIHLGTDRTGLQLLLEDELPRNGSPVV
ncbi:uncharacterized protein [Branchiostoma lanceolatum]|uniref:uncharacterized protein n=1 Tax=Branchiostoma lanceolatum TaxID=7740 RepID=UPI003452D2E9